MTYNEIKDSFFREFPEFNDDLNRHINEYGEILYYVLFPQIYYDHIVKILKSSKNLVWINRFFNFLELMSESENKVRDLLSLTFLDNMRDDLVILDIAKRYSRPNTCALLENILQQYGKVNYQLKN